jgi:hypothetical protein
MYAKTHEWMHVETDSTRRQIVTAGLSENMLDLLIDSGNF